MGRIKKISLDEYDFKENVKREIWKLAYHLLTDDNSISQSSYESLLQIFTFVGIEDIQLQVDATDGRFYIPEDCD